jgi:hypothetical protein
MARYTAQNSPPGGAPVNWEAIAAMGEVAGAAGVILSLLYLSRQIGQNTRQMRVATHDATTSDLRAFARQALSGGYARLFARGLEDYESLDAEERLDFAFVMFDMFKTFENAHYHYLHGSMGEDAWRAWHRLLASYAVAPGAQHYWSARRDIFTLEFRGVVDSLDRTSEDVKRVWHATKM